ncbi:MAG: flagellar motor protein MotB [Bryobacteraceae bacterium]|jgi:chemotaxis protein MotB
MESPPIIIVKRRRAHNAHHGGAWKVAYADFVTAMMAFFIVLWLLSSSEQVQKAVGGYFSDPTGYGKDVGNGLRGVGGESLSIRATDMSKLKEKLDQAIRQTASLQKIKEHVVMAVTGEGLRVELTEGSQGTFFFESGSPLPTGDGKDLLSKLAAEIGKMPNKVIIEGHTDANSFVGRNDYSNWELSSDRANSARRWMQQNGLRPDQIAQVRGYADQKPRNPADPEDPSNRRITLIIQNLPDAAVTPPSPKAPANPKH